MEKSRETQMQKRAGCCRLVLFPVPLQGHLNPMLQLANILHSKGFSITIIHTHFNSPNPSNYPHFTFLPISDSLSESEATTADLIALVTLLNVNCVAPFRDCLACLLSNASEEEPISCLITDALWHCTQAVAHSFHLPRMVLRTSNVCSFLAFAALPLLNRMAYLPIQELERRTKNLIKEKRREEKRRGGGESKLEAPIPELPPLKVKDIPVINTQNQDSFFNLIASMIKEIKASSGLIWNSFEDLEESAMAILHQEFPIPIFPIGPFHKYFPASSSSLLTQDQSSISWLDTQAPKSVLYISFGSIAAMDEAEFLDIAWGLANSKQPFLWVVRPGLVRGSEWLEPLPSGFLEMMDGRGHIVKWAPQQQVLAHSATGGFWTHNGWNSTLESICEGVPMICLPYFGDQRVNARYVSDVWRIGLILENGLERGKIEEAIRRLMVEEEGKQMRERIMYLKKKVNGCLRPGGSSYQSLEKLICYILSI